MAYDLKPAKVPKFAGNALKTLVNLLENNFSRRFVEFPLVRELGLDKLRNMDIQEEPTHQPHFPPGKMLSAEKVSASLQVFDYDHYRANPRKGFQPPTSFDFARAYRTGKLAPTQVAEKVIDAIQASSAGHPPLNAISHFNDQNIRAQARESEARLKAGQPLSVLDGVPVAVKDELDMLPYATMVGTRVYGQNCSAQQDATTVARLRAAGALLIGKTNMQEIGFGVTGYNAHYGVVRNPYDLSRYSGGSSSGSAAAVAAGLCPIAVGADGGGSVRIPAALCGVVGLKPTWSRLSEFGAAPLCWSVAHVGPIGTSVDDVALAYSLMAGPDPNDAWTLEQPPAHLQDYLQDGFEGLRIGMFSPWFSHADRELVQTCQLAVEHLKRHGASMHEVRIEELDAQRIAHAVTISSEMLTAVDDEFRRDAKRFGLETRLNLSLAQAFSSRDYIKSQQIRTRAIRYFQEALSKVDMLVMPTTGIAAPHINDKVLATGESDLNMLTELTRFATCANLTGLPALTVPVGYTREGLPIGLQLLGRPWEEHKLLRVGRGLEQEIERRRPQLYYDLL